MKKDTRERFTLRIPTDLFVQIQNNANNIGTSINALILQILWDFVKKNEADQKENQLQEA